MNIHTIESTAQLNHIIQTGFITELIRNEEALKSQQIAALADEISAKNHALKWIWLAGPSSAGKTTFTKRLGAALNVRGVDTHMISLDNYFLNRELTPKNSKGEYDYEHIEAIDLPLLERHLGCLEEGHTIEMPHFKFLHGRREFRGEIIHLKSNQIALIEGIHALNPRITSFVDTAHSLKLYICARTSLKLADGSRISTTNNRLLRRLVRDNTFRGNTAAHTFKQWPSVRAGEDKWIFPHQPEADREFNSATAYEISVLRPLAEPLIQASIDSNEGRQKALELLALLENFDPLDRSVVPPKAILHEFIDSKA